jgi:hypothetical protein
MFVDAMHTNMICLLFQICLHAAPTFALMGLSVPAILTQLTFSVMQMRGSSSLSWPLVCKMIYDARFHSWTCA